MVSDKRSLQTRWWDCVFVGVCRIFQMVRKDQTHLMVPPSQSLLTV